MKQPGIVPRPRTSLLFVGDVMLGRFVNEILRRMPPTYPWGDTLPLFRRADVRICNLECVISDRGQPWSATPKVFHFRTDAKNIEVLKVADISMVSLANNHMLDFEYDAMLDALAILDSAGVYHAGAGRSFQEASAPAILVANEMKVGCIAFTDNEPAWEATDARPGIFYVPVDLSDRRAEALLELVRQAKEKVSLLIISAHWGPNWGYRPPSEHVSFGRALIDAGADLVFGHSAHICRGIEVYKDKLIIYSAGDFIDDYAVDEVERNDRSFIFVVEAQGERISNIRLYPTVIRDFQARRAQSNEAVETALKMKRLCTDLGTAADWRADEGFLEIEVGQR